MRDLGADAFLAIMEVYFPIGEAGVELDFTEVARAAGDLPVVLYTDPRFQRFDPSLLLPIVGIDLIGDALRDILNSRHGR